MFGWATYCYSKGYIFNFIELSRYPEEIENANEILCEQDSRVIEIQNIVKNYFETSFKFSKICSLKVFKSKKSTFQRSSKNPSSSSHWKNVDEAEEILWQTKEQFERKVKLLEQQKRTRTRTRKGKDFWSANETQNSRIKTTYRQYVFKK